MLRNKCGTPCRTLCALLVAAVYKLFGYLHGLAYIIVHQPKVFSGWHGSQYYALAIAVTVLKQAGFALGGCFAGVHHRCTVGRINGAPL